MDRVVRGSDCQLPRHDVRAIKALSHVVFDFTLNRVYITDFTRMILYKYQVAFGRNPGRALVTGLRTAPMPACRQIMRRTSDAW